MQTVFPAQCIKQIITKGGETDEGCYLGENYLSNSVKHCFVKGTVTKFFLSFKAMLNIDAFGSFPGSNPHPSLPVRYHKFLL